MKKKEKIIPPKMFAHFENVVYPFGAKWFELRWKTQKHLTLKVMTIKKNSSLGVFS